jgi:hypothetical protein
MVYLRFRRISYQTQLANIHDLYKNSQVGRVRIGPDVRRRCFLGMTFGSTFRACLINSLGTPGISAGFHTNISRLARRKLPSASSYLSPKPALMTAVLDESPS